MPVPKGHYCCRLGQGKSNRAWPPGTRSGAFGEIGGLAYWPTADPVIALALREDEAVVACSREKHFLSRGRPRGDARRTRHNAVTGVILFDDTCNSFRLSKLQRGCYIEEWVLSCTVQAGRRMGNWAWCAALQHPHSDYSPFLTPRRVSFIALALLTGPRGSCPDLCSTAVQSASPISKLLGQPELRDLRQSALPLFPQNRADYDRPRARHFLASRKGYRYWLQVCAGP